jgi:DNA-binding IscR family transcriptional regulator
LCKSRLAWQDALLAFFEVLDTYTLADLIDDPLQLAPLLGLERDVVECVKEAAAPL